MLLAFESLNVKEPSEKCPKNQQYYYNRMSEKILFRWQEVGDLKKALYKFVELFETNQLMIQ